jgi:iron-sulfur cluster assembly accessory protein
MASHRPSAAASREARVAAGSTTWGIELQWYNEPSLQEKPEMINVSETAAAKITELLAEENKNGSGLRVFVQGGGCSGFQYGLMIEESGEGSADQIFESHGVKLFVDPISLQYLKNAEVDFVDTVTGGGFTIKNPNATSTCGCGSSFTTE